MDNSKLVISNLEDELFLSFSGELTLYDIAGCQKIIDEAIISAKSVVVDLSDVIFIDTAAAIFIYKLQDSFSSKKINASIKCDSVKINDTLALAAKYKNSSSEIKKIKKTAFVEQIGITFHDYFLAFLSFMEFFGILFATQARDFKNPKNIRFREIAFEINESAIKALGIIALTSFLIGVVIAYQSAFQLKIYGANIFIVDMLGISMLRELAPLITAIVIAGRSGSAFTAQIGAMKITQELDAMRAMGFDPYEFLVLPRIIALMVAMPILIFVSDVMGVFGGMIVASLDLKITPELFLDRFNEVVAAKHFFIGLIKGPFFAFLIASIGIYRGLRVKDDTQSIGFNTTKSVVESIFAVIVCDAVFSIAFTNLGI